MITSKDSVSRHSSVSSQQGQCVLDHQPHTQRREHQQPAQHHALLQRSRQLPSATHSFQGQQEQVAAVERRQRQQVDRSQVDVDNGAELVQPSRVCESGFRSKAAG